MSPDSEICPKCHNKEFDSAGICLVCGASIRAVHTGPTDAGSKPENPSYSGLIEMDCSPGAQSGTTEVPEWRQELSRRLTEIRRRRGLENEPEGPTLPFPQTPPVTVPDAASTPVQKTAEKPVSAPAVAEKPQPAVPPVEPPKAPVRRLRPVSTPEEKPLPKPIRPARKGSEILPLFDADTRKPPAPASPVADLMERATAPPEAAPEKIQSWIDTMVARPPAPEKPVPSAPWDELHEDKLILLSRILSGLIDLLIVGLCAGSFIVAADAFSGIDVIDNVSKLYYAVLLLAIHFVYSVFFMGITNQTVGMMIKDLRVVDGEGRRPPIGSVVGRTAAYVLAWLSLGLGLVWAAFDRDSLCLHDKLSHTHIVRL